MSVFTLFLGFLVAQRLFELALARVNERHVKKLGAVEFDTNGYRVIAAFHSLFFISLITEKTVLDTPLVSLWIPLGVLFALAQVLRYWAIFSLGRLWNTKILVVPGMSRVTAGPYAFMNHPNYLAVIIEFVTVPLIFSCYFTAVVFSLLNLLILKRRIGIEEAHLENLSR
ncbi:MAG: hypothetical protein IH874_08470 [Candidatus Dadabacteria bacterium]|nr:hypothetical protein [Candidatus Dadabacteria bacterium]